MTWEEIAQIVRNGYAESLFPDGSLVQLPYKGELEWFRVVNHGIHWDTDKSPTPSMTLELEHIWEPFNKENFMSTTPTKEWRNEKERYSRYLELLKEIPRIHDDLDKWWEGKDDKWNDRKEDGVDIYGC